jgi:hypothetical protein
MNQQGFEFCVVLNDTVYFIKQGDTAENKLANYLPTFNKVYIDSAEIEMTSDGYDGWVGGYPVHIRGKSGSTGNDIYQFTTEKPFTFTYEKGEVNGFKGNYIITDVWTGNGTEIKEIGD